jgi:hypothetical protein
MQPTEATPDKRGLLKGENDKLKQCLPKYFANKILEGMDKYYGAYFLFFGIILFGKTSKNLTL